MSLSSPAVCVYENVFLFSHFQNRKSFLCYLNGVLIVDTVCKQIKKTVFCYSDNPYCLPVKVCFTFAYCKVT